MLALRFSRYAKFAWGVLAYNFLVVVWGAYVRASGSGAGCGRHWPTCDGEVLPMPKSTQMFVEFAHRASSGVALLLVVVMAIVAFLRFPKGSAVRRFAVASTAFMFSEALLGAALVLFELVAHDASMKRALSMCLHLVNTFFLLASIAGTAYAATTGKNPRLRFLGAQIRTAAFTVVTILPVAMSGGVAALGDTLFPARSIQEGVAQDLSGSGHIFLQLRLFHPLLAIVAAVVVALYASGVAKRHPKDWWVTRMSWAVSLVVLVQVCLGVLNLVLLAPVPTQLLHLLGADTLFVTVSLLVLSLSVAEERAESPARSSPEPVPTQP
jgi:heme A synthase